MLRMRIPSAFILCGISLILALASGCKKNSSSTPSLVGTWRNVDTASSSGFKYLVLRSDQSAYKLGTLIYNLRLKNGAVYVVENDKVTIPLSGMGATEYSYKLSGDTLYLTSPGSSWRFKKDADQDPATWVKDINVNSFSPTGSGFWFGPMDYNGTSYVVSSPLSKKIYTINGSNTLLVDSTAVLPGTAPAVVSTASEAWVSMPSIDLKLRKLDLPTSAVTSLSTAAPGGVICMAKHGSKILALTTTGTFYDYDPVADNFTSLVSMPALFSGSIPTGYVDLEVKDNKVYLLYFTYLLEVDLSSGQFAQTYALNSNTTGLSLAGSYFGLCYDGAAFATQRLTQGTSPYDIHIDIAKFNLP